MIVIDDDIKAPEPLKPALKSKPEPKKRTQDVLVENRKPAQIPTQKRPKLDNNQGTLSFMRPKPEVLPKTQQQVQREVPPISQPTNEKQTRQSWHDLFNSPEYLSVTAQCQKHFKNDSLFALVHQHFKQARLSFPCHSRLLSETYLSLFAHSEAPSAEDDWSESMHRIAQFLERNTVCPVPAKPTKPAKKKRLSCVHL